MSEQDIEIIERDNNIPPEKSILSKPKGKTIMDIGLSAWLMPWHPTNDQSDWCPKEGDIMSCGNREYKIYRRGKWRPIAYEKVVDPSKPSWEEYISKPFMEEKC